MAEPTGTPRAWHVVQRTLTAVWVPTNIRAIPTLRHGAAGNDGATMVWLAGCPARHRARDCGDVEPHDRAVNDHAVRCGEVGRCPATRSPTTSPPPPFENEVWVITDDLGDRDTDY